MQSFYPAVSFWQGNNFSFSSNLQSFYSSKPHTCLWDDQGRHRVHGLDRLNLPLLRPKDFSAPLSIRQGEGKERICVRTAVLDHTEGPLNLVTGLWQALREVSKASEGHTEIFVFSLIPAGLQKSGISRARCNILVDPKFDVTTMPSKINGFVCIYADCKQPRLAQQIC